MRELITIDQQTQYIYKQKGIEEGIQLGRAEKAKEDYDKMIKEGIPEEVAKEIAFGD